jgi:hypothetical protein
MRTPSSAGSHRGGAADNGGSSCCNCSRSAEATLAPPRLCGPRELDPSIEVTVALADAFEERLESSGTSIISTLDPTHAVLDGDRGPLRGK